MHPASHNTRIPISDAMVRLGTMCPVRIVGNPGIAMSQQCVDLTLAPSGRLIDNGFCGYSLVVYGNSLHDENGGSSRSLMIVRLDCLELCALYLPRSAVWLWGTVICLTFLL